MKLHGLTSDTKQAVLTLIDKAKAKGLNPVVVSGFRTCEEQAKIFASNQPGKITVSGARGCRSWHLWGRAVDFQLQDSEGRAISGNDKRYDELGAMGKELGFRWGGDFQWGRDAGHFEFHPGLSISELCPDSSESACEQQISSNTQDNLADIVPVNLTQIDESGLNWGEVIGSAAIGAVVFHLIGKLVR